MPYWHAGSFGCAFCTFYYGYGRASRPTGKTREINRFSLRAVPLKTAASETGGMNIFPGIRLHSIENKADNFESQWSYDHFGSSRTVPFCHAMVCILCSGLLDDISGSGIAVEKHGSGKQQQYCYSGFLLRVPTATTCTSFETNLHE
jgi:hypothetical protein